LTLFTYSIQTVALAITSSTSDACRPQSDISLGNGGTSSASVSRRLVRGKCGS
jgi:hypothetical protein